MSAYATELLSTPFLRIQRVFPNDEIKLLSGQIDQAYIDIAIKVNLRTIGIFSSSGPLVNGETWYLSGYEQNPYTLRQVYQFGPIASGTSILIPTNIDIPTFGIFTRIWGTCITASGTNFRPIPYINPNALGDGIGVLVGNFGAPPIQEIQITVGPTSPPIGSGFIVLEWLIEIPT
jgi:hypothetical protein